MIKKKDFYKLRLNKYIPKKDIDKVWYFAYLGKYWIGETYYFTHYLRLMNSPLKCKSVSIGFEEIHWVIERKMFQDLEIPINRNTNLNETVDSYGEPAKIEEYVHDRKTYIFHVGENKEYEMSLTYLNEGKLVYFTMHLLEVSV